MAAKYIHNELWKQIEKKLVEAVIETKTSVKDADILKLVIEVGLRNLKKEDYWEMAKNKAKNE